MSLPIPCPITPSPAVRRGSCGQNGSCGQCSATNATASSGSMKGRLPTPVTHPGERPAWKSESCRTSVQPRAFREAESQTTPGLHESGGTIGVSSVFNETRTDTDRKRRYRISGLGRPRWRREANRPTIPSPARASITLEGSGTAEVVLRVRLSIAKYYGVLMPNWPTSDEAKPKPRLSDPASGVRLTRVQTLTGREFAVV